MSEERRKSLRGSAPHREIIGVPSLRGAVPAMVVSGTNKRPANQIRFPSLHLLFPSLLMGLAPFSGHAQSVEHATKDKVMAALPKLETLAQGIVDGDKVPGLAIAVVYQDKVVYLKGFGHREEGKDAPVDADTVCQVASFAKPMASTVVASIVSDGRVGWDSRIADIDPVFKLYEAYPTDQVTVRDLFSHRSGLPGGAGNELEELGYDRDVILNRLRQVKPSSSFRSGWSYSNFGLTEGGVAAAKAAGMSWEDAAEARLYKPLGMTSTSSRYADFLKRPNRAELHVRIDGKWKAIVKRDPDPQSPAGGVSSNVRDLAEWMRLELGNGKYAGEQLIREGAIAETHVPLMQRGKHPISGASSFYGLERRIWSLRGGLGPRRRLQRRSPYACQPASWREARYRGLIKRLPDRRAGGARRYILRPGHDRRGHARLVPTLGPTLWRPLRTVGRSGSQAAWYTASLAAATAAAFRLHWNLCQRLHWRGRDRREEWRARNPARTRRQVGLPAQTLRSRSLHLSAIARNADSAGCDHLRNRAGPEGGPGHDRQI